jgi:hypothetical protein
MRCRIRIYTKDLLVVNIVAKRAAHYSEGYKLVTVVQVDTDAATTIPMDNVLRIETQPLKEQE